MRGLDDWISRGHERLDDDPPELHPDDASQDAAIDAELARGQGTAFEVSLLHMLRLIQELEDETMGAALAARFDTEGGDHEAK